MHLRGVISKGQIDYRENQRRSQTKWRVLGLVFVIAGVLLILTPWTIFPVCGVGRYAPPPGQTIGHHGCHNTLYIETIIGIITAVIGLISVIWSRHKVVLFASISVLCLAVLAVLFPFAITGVCKMSTMACRLGTIPGLVTVAIIMGLSAVIGLGLSRKRP